MRTPLQWTLGVLAATVVLVSAEAWAQQRQPQLQQQQGQQRFQAQQPQGQQRTALRPVQGGQSLTDHQIAEWLLHSNEMEEQLAQFALQHAHSNEVKQFAQMMIQGHGKLIEQLRQFAPNTPPLRAAGQAEQRTGLNEPQGQQAVQGEQVQGGLRQQQNPQPQFQQQTQVQGQPGQPIQAGLPMSQVSTQMAQRMLASIERELGQKQGSEFDKCFIGAQIFQHIALLNALEVLRPYASPQLQNLINAAIPETQQHLQHAKQVEQQLTGGGRATEQGRTGRNEDSRQQDQQERNNRQ